MMKSNLALSLRQKTGLTLSQSLRHAIDMLQYNTIELKIHIREELEKNPLLDLLENETAEVTEQESENFSAAITKGISNNETLTKDILENIPQQKTLRMHLLDQLLSSGLHDTEEKIAEMLIDSIDEKGYLTQDLDDILYLMNHSVDRLVVEKVLAKIQAFDPVGVGAFDLRECFLLQLKDKEKFLSEFSERVIQVAICILQDHFDQFLLFNKKNIIKLPGVPYEVLRNAMLLIKRLDPAPGLKFAEIDTKLYEEPELNLTYEKNNWRVNLRESLLTQIKINQQYSQLILQNKSNTQFQSMREELTAARFLLSGLKKRNETLLLVAQYIIDQQVSFIEQGPALMLPLRLSDVACALNLHESTVSRITTGKYIATQQGVYELKYFFSQRLAAIHSNQVGHSATSVKSLIKKYISDSLNDDSRQMSDLEIANKLKNEGISIARRTVAKYRKAIGVESCYRRGQEKFKF